MEILWDACDSVLAWDLDSRTNSTLNMYYMAGKIPQRRTFLNILDDLFAERNAGYVVGIFASQQIESVNFRQKTFSL